MIVYASTPIIVTLLLLNFSSDVQMIQHGDKWYGLYGSCKANDINHVLDKAFQIISVIDLTLKITGWSLVFILRNTI